ncbi:hypothetical protein A2X44_04290 [candidate division CPR3 bacterium GWF2_35_18]|uniref:Nudix hydrolase domain-containing protein n=1 Tax=candidate division CPR3 bacterium GW2011_GWF2_35_18 TaxID=1618350 RepID=A0A0G0BIT8_UNCC3|nr:MAG: hypothetical protein UR67_C0007G0048 [candidate division CPR3 bacterium GW2011_GWF2_35_18]KKP86952.1 MAG: hypothetical protein UR87_C0007G0014 [candidate division CPR3 bacterium GW2011_GWE2_35_7]OGB62574.1 MAG: hypothetical protein A2X44_04290 [candidate division CPR3 bacterium GWF2_35_18]OGB65825.1 MAG: hypothetical protein A2250_01540 [candidate division CPR3 bacterium RIFOXYA2_FULL_35_13]OGB77352.1 MAG: hypothetical protein A2476_04030 [candidate division CPR3 bacterium RIFOXYC2_FULL
MKEKIVKVSCEMILEKGGKVLLGKRKNIFGAGQWAFPGGHLEVGESTLDCAKRELFEETGVKANEIDLFAVVNDTPNHQEEHYVRFVYIIKSWKGEIANAEPDCCEGWNWFSKDELPEPFFVGHQKVLPIYLGKIKTVTDIKVLER